MKEDFSLERAFIDEAWQLRVSGSEEQGSGEGTIISIVAFAKETGI